MPARTGKSSLVHLEDARPTPIRNCFRDALKLATGFGENHVMAIRPSTILLASAKWSPPAPNL